MKLARLFLLAVLLGGCDSQDDASSSPGGTFPCDAAFCAAGEEVCVYDEEGVVTAGQDERVCVSSEVFGGCAGCACLAEDCYSCQETAVGAYCLIFSEEPE